MKKVSPQLFTFGFMLLLFLLVLGAYIFLYIEIRAKNEHVSTAINEAEAQADVNSSEQSLQDLLTNTEADRTKIASIVLSDDKVVGFIEAVEALGPITHTKVTTTFVNINEETGSSNTGF